MNPWEILGWFLVGAIGVLIAASSLIAIGKAYGAVRAKARRYRLHFKTRNIAPAKGQRWDEGSHTIEITNVYDNGIIGMRSGNASWGDTPDAWKRRIRYRRSYLIGGGS